MINDLATLRTSVLELPNVADLIGDCIWCGVDEPPESAGYTPANGPALVINRTDLTRPQSRGEWQSNRYVVKAYGVTQIAADGLFRALVDDLDCHASGQIARALLDSGGRILSEPDTGWFFNLSFWRFYLRDNT